MRGSPSLVGRGIANPMSARTRGFESHSPRLCDLRLDLIMEFQTSRINGKEKNSKAKNKQSKKHHNGSVS